MKKILLFSGILILFPAELLRLYFIMPFAGSQELNSISFAYFLYHYIGYIRVFGSLLIIAGCFVSFSQRKTFNIILFSSLTVIYIIFQYIIISWIIVPGKSFPLIEEPRFLSFNTGNVDPGKPVIGLTINGESKAYPVEIIAFHHIVQDTIGGEPVIITYCSACHTARVFSSIINNKQQSFHIIGMSFFNLVMEDSSTESWWQQATGIAVAGAMKGSMLKEIYFDEAILSEWSKEHPGALVLQPVDGFVAEYAQMGGSARGALQGELDNRDRAPWQPKSWIVGVKNNGVSKAYDWNTLLMKQVIEDTVAGLPVMLAIGPDGRSYHVWNREVKGQSLEFTIAKNKLMDITNSVWNFDGVCESGPMAGQRLKTVHASQEFWHSWKHFHPGTLRYN